MAAITENYQLKWHSFGSHLHSYVASSLNSDAFADVSLFTMDGRHILAHRFILSACSQYFHQVLKTQQKITTTLPLVIILPPEINYKTMKTLTQYMYSGETTVSKDILENVLRGGDILKVKGLWRPKDDEYHNKIVKLHENRDSMQSPSHSFVGRQILVHKNTNSTNSKENKTCDNETNITKSSQKIVCNRILKKENFEKLKELQTQQNQEENKSHREAEDQDSDNLQFLVIKDEPIEWSEINDGEMEMVDEDEVFHSEMTIKPEVVLDDNYNEKSEEIYSPLTCELCAEVFSIPAEWVRHIQTHTDMLPAKRQRRGRLSAEDDGSTFPPLHCDMCQKYFPTPAEWVRHIQNTHTEFELRASNKSNPVRPLKITRQPGSSHKICCICNKKFPSHASMLIHKRTHTGEKPYMCSYCQKGFNVKSNLLRHLRTLHDKIVNSTEVDASTEDNGGDSGEQN